jgi:hypothetical protein
VPLLEADETAAALWARHLEAADTMSTPAALGLCPLSGEVLKTTGVLREQFRVLRSQFDVLDYRAGCVLRAMP